MARDNLPTLIAELRARMKNIRDFALTSLPARQKSKNSKRK